MDADTSEKIRDVISFVHSRTLSIGVYSPGDVSVTNMYEEAASDLAEIIQQEIAKAVAKTRQDALIVFAATLKATGGEVTFTKADLMIAEDYSITQYTSEDGSVRYELTLKEHKDNQ